MSRAELVDNQALRRAIIVGTFLQVIIVLLAHFSRWIEEHVFLFGAMMISATSGYLYAQEVAKGYWRGAYGGAIAGGICGVIGIALSLVLGDASPVTPTVRTLVSILTGAVGGIYGQMAADWR